jgi:hypothetical protein
MSTSAAGDNAFITEFNQKDHHDESEGEEMNSDASGEQESS